MLWLAGQCLGQEGREIARNAFPSVVLVLADKGKAHRASLGSGFFVQDNLIVTNYHVIKGSSRISVKLVGRKDTYNVRVVTTSSAKDLALLRVVGIEATPLSLGDVSQVAIGDNIYAIGNPEGLEATLSQGIVSGIRQSGGNRYFQITAPISHGSSGGPVLNSSGDVIGVAVGMLTRGQNLNFAIPISDVTALIMGTPEIAAGAAAGVDDDAKYISEGTTTQPERKLQVRWELVSNDGVAFFRDAKRTYRTVEGTVLSWIKKVPDLGTEKGREWHRDSVDFINRQLRGDKTLSSNLRGEMYSYDVALVEYDCAAGKFHTIQIRYYDSKNNILFVNDWVPTEWHQVPPDSVAEELMEAACHSVPHP